MKVRNVVVLRARTAPLDRITSLKANLTLRGFHCVEQLTLFIHDKFQFYLKACIYVFHLEEF